MKAVREWPEELGRNFKVTYSDHVIEVHSFVTVVVDLNLTSKDINKGLPLEVLGEGTKSFPFTGEGLSAV